VLELGNIGSEFTVDFCDGDDACTRVKVSIALNAIKADYAGSREMNEPAPRRREWGRNGMEYARDRAAFVTGRTRGSYCIDGGTQCTRVVMECSDAGAQWLCTIYCPR